jgi:hypothetical protein
VARYLTKIVPEEQRCDLLENTCSFDKMSAVVEKIDECIISSHEEKLRAYKIRVFTDVCMRRGVQFVARKMRGKNGTFNKSYIYSTPNSSFDVHDYWGAMRRKGERVHTFRNSLTVVVKREHEMEKY